jgi:hypothetical protein
MKKAILAALLAGAALLGAAPPAQAGTLSTAVIGLFPKDLGEFAYADLKTARKFPWFAQIKEQMLPTRFRQFESFLATAGVDPNATVEELAWGATLPTETQGDMVVGVALGQFQPTATEEFFKRQKLPTVKSRGYTLFAFGSGADAADILFFFIDSNTAAFGHREVLEKLIEVRFGISESLLRNDQLFPLIDEVNGRGLVWAVLNQGYTQLAMQQLVPEAAQFPEASKLMAKMKALLLEIQAGSTVDARFQTVVETPDDANLFAALLQAGLLYRRYQEAQTNPDLAKVLEDARITPKGDRLELRLGMSEETLVALIKKNTFAVRM